VPVQFPGLASDLRGVCRRESRALRSDTFYRFRYDNSDDNRDDNCSPNNRGYRAVSGVSCLVVSPARSWQCGGQGFESP
jgi:hypothetical protein